MAGVVLAEDLVFRPRQRRHLLPDTCSPAVSAGPPWLSGGDGRARGQRPGAADLRRPFGVAFGSSIAAVRPPSTTPLVDLPDLAQLGRVGINSSTDTSALGVKFRVVAPEGRRAGLGDPGPAEADQIGRGTLVESSSGSRRFGAAQLAPVTST